MKKTDSVKAYQMAYARFRRLTPLSIDCGLLCGKRCCQGGDNEGMILFPEEETPPAMHILTGNDINGYPLRVAVCPGRCRRRTRPLACRLFPLAPYLDSEGKLSAIPDPRAKFMCPLLAKDVLPMIPSRFYRAVELAFAGLLPIEGFRPMLEAYSRMLDEYRRFTG
ncbi:MAG: hypothetical protein FWH28_06045 [Clostridiales bacterium]|nr:hypothetical protein [Clostridiales bacterium]